MKSNASLRLLALIIGVALLPSCSLTYQKLLQERDLKIRELHLQNTELSATNQDLEARALGARQRIAALELRLQQKPESPPADVGLAKLRSELPGVDVRLEDNRLSLGINNKVTFSAGSTRLKDSANSVLRNVAKVLNREFPGQRIIVEGHTDTDPLRRTKKLYRHNRHLSVERADAVADFLIKRCGVTEASVVVAGYGAHKPLRDGSGRAAKAANRRVEIVVAGGM